MAHTPETVRLAQPADTDALVQLVREYCTEDHHEFREARVRSALSRLLEDDSFGLVWVIGDPLAGYAVVTWGYSLESGNRGARRFYTRLGFDIEESVWMSRDLV